MPTLKSQAGDYPFIVRVINENGHPENKQYSISVLDPESVEEVEEEEDFTITTLSEAEETITEFAATETVEDD